MISVSCSGACTELAGVSAGSLGSSYVIFPSYTSSVIPLRRVTHPNILQQAVRVAIVGHGDARRVMEKGKGDILLGPSCVFRIVRCRSTSNNSQHARGSSS